MLHNQHGNEFTGVNYLVNCNYHDGKGPDAVTQLRIGYNYYQYLIFKNNRLVLAELRNGILGPILKTPREVNMSIRKYDSIEAATQDDPINSIILFLQRAEIPLIKNISVMCKISSNTLVNGSAQDVALNDEIALDNSKCAPLENAIVLSSEKVFNHYLLIATRFINENQNGSSSLTEKQAKSKLIPTLNNKHT